MHIAHPWFLILLIIPPLLLYHVIKKRKERSTGVQFPLVQLVKKASHPFTRQLLFLPWLLRTLMLTLLILGLARFQFGVKSEENITRGTDIIICLDTSPSMKALDFKPKNRITVAREVVKNFIRGRSHDRIGMVVFAGASVSVCPLTTDYSALLTFLESVNEGVTKTDGTAIGDGIATSINRLKGSTAKSKIIILVTDGRNNVGMIDPLTAAKLAKTLGIKIYAIGVGGKGPAPYPIDDPVFGTRYISIDEDLDEETLSQIARETAGKYERATDPESLKNIFDLINRMEKTELKTKVNIDYKELYPLFLWPAFVLLAAEILLSGTVLRKIP